MRQLVCLVILIPLFGSAQRQYADTLFSPHLHQPRYTNLNGSNIFVDEAHFNFHVIDGRYRPFADLLRRDGYVIHSYKEAVFSEKSLKNCDILVIANALNAKNVEHWQNPIYPAFSVEEINEIENWVKNGGSLFLIADHMPFAGASSHLAAAFGYKFLDGFAIDTVRASPDHFTLQSGQLFKNRITTYNGQQLDSIMTFTGQAFEIPKDANPILKVGKTWVVYQPEIAWEIDKNTPKILADNLYQGAYQDYGEGRLVIFGEAAMFSAQIAEENGHVFKAGMNQSDAKNNYKLLLSIIHWLDPRDQK